MTHKKDTAYGINRRARIQRNPLSNDRWEVNKHKPSSYPMVI